MESKRPNSFILKGQDITITYDLTSFSGQPLLAYQKEGKQLTFMGENIRKLDSEIGQLVSVDIGYIPDLARITLTILIPIINHEGAEVPFRTEAIITQHLTSIAGPAMVKGPLQVYAIESLEGKARFIVP